MTESDMVQKPTAASLLADWRAAERDLVAARGTASIAELAANAAEVARAAALETREAARLSSVAAQRAEVAARRTADAAEVTASAATTDKGNAGLSLQVATTAEASASEAYHAAERDGFPKA